jgi:LDH2 family malate/lactate/ureidoglycolate dehydrogenase
MVGQEREKQDQVFAADSLRRFAQLVFQRLGMSSDDAGVIADHLVWADLRALRWQGVQRLPQFVARLQHGGTNPSGAPAVVTEKPSFALLDGDDMWGHVAGVRAMTMAVEKARTTGIGVVVVRNTTSAGALGYYAAQAAEQQMIGLAINNSAPLQPPWNGTKKALGNQAFAIASPTGGGAPLLFDSATSAMSFVRIHEHMASGEALPDGVALSSDGQPTTDPAAALEGMLLPMGGHRGYGLALMWEVLTGVLSGGERFASNVSMPHDHGRPQGVSLLLLAIDPGAALPYARFTLRVDALIEEMQASPPVAGVERVTVPGERSAAIAEVRGREGIPLAPELVATLRGLGAELGVPWPRPSAASRS